MFLACISFMICYRKVGESTVLLGHIKNDASFLISSGTVRRS